MKISICVTTYWAMALSRVQKNFPTSKAPSKPKFRVTYNDVNRSLNRAGTRCCSSVTNLAQDLLSQSF